jgi:uncharacterized membrane protein
MMRWLLIVLLVSLAGLLIAAAGLARYVWLRRPCSRIALPGDAPHGPGKADEIEVKAEI